MELTVSPIRLGLYSFISLQDHDVDLTWIGVF